MNEHPKVSIVVPAYNAAGYIEGCVNSVLTQSCGSFELIIVNDGSKDDTAAVVSAVAEKDSRVRLLTVENGGPAAAREHGLAIANPEAEYIMFLDSDDRLLPDALEYALGGAKDADMVIFGYTIVGVDGSERYYCEPEQLIDRAGMAEALPRLYKANLLNQVWGKLYRASLIRSNGIRFRDFRWGEDRLYVFDCLEKIDRVSVLPGCKYRYIMHRGESLITKYYDRKLEVCLLSDKRIEQLCTEFGAESDGSMEYMFMKSIFSCLTNLFTPSCPLNYLEKRSYVRRVVTNRRVLRRSEAATGGAAVKLPCAVIRSGNVTLTMFTFRMMALAGKLFPKLFMQIKHRK